jgi:hypothetical protein
MGRQNRFWRILLATALAALLPFLPWGEVVAQDSSPATYTDLSGHSGEAEIRSLLDAGILEIEPDGEFHPDQPFTRLSFLPPLARMSRLNSTTPTYPAAVPFTDVPVSNYAYPDLQRILQTALHPDRIFRGIAEGLALKPDLSLTVAEGLALIVRSRGWVGGIQFPGSSPFADVSFDHWAFAEIFAAYQHGLFYADTVYPDTPLARWQGAVYLSRALGQEPQKTIFVSLAQYDWSLYLVEGAFAMATFPQLSGQAGMESPTGDYTVLSKSDVTTMSGADYEVPNVRWCLFFIGRTYAIHGNWWKPDGLFGQDPSINGSHGCVGLIQPLEGDEGKPGEKGRDDAKIVYDWAPVGTPIVITTDLLRDQFHSRP